MSKCNTCGDNVDFANGGIALMIAFVHGRTTSLTNVAICGCCYRKHGIDKAIKNLDESARLHFEFPENEE